MLGDLTEPDVDEKAGLVFLPIRRPLGPDEQVHATVLRLADGRRALPAFTSLGALLHACGPKQVWACFPAPLLERESAFDLIVLDPPVLRTQSGEHDFPGKPEGWDD